MPRSILIIILLISGGCEPVTRGDLLQELEDLQENPAPVADAGGDITALIGPAVFLDGSASADPRGDVLSYSWFIGSVPAGSAIGNADINSADTAAPDFTPDIPGTYVLELIVSDGKTARSDTVTVVIKTANTAPIADAGPDQAVSIGATATLDGSGSSDADADPLTYAWRFSALPGGSILTDADISGINTVAPSFVPDVNGVFIMELTVSDGIDTATDLVDITASGGNNPPVADAGVDQNVATGAPAAIDGTATSDPDLDPLTYAWTFLSVPVGSILTDADIAGIATATPSFTPDVDGVYTLELTADDGIDSSTDQVDVTATSANVPPTADAGPDQSLHTGNVVNLDGSGSFDADLDPITYLWAFTAVPVGSAITVADLSDPAVITPFFTSDVGGTYTLQLTVDDGTDTGTDTVDIFVNTPPVANAGTDQTVSLPLMVAVSLDSSGSTDAESDPLTHTWTLSSRPAGSILTTGDITGANTTTPSFTPDVAGTYTLSVNVHDGTDGTSDTVDILVNTPPVADAGVDQNVSLPTTVNLDGGASSDADLNPLAYSWTFITVPGSSAITDADLSDTAVITPFFTPDVGGTYTLQLTVDDGIDTAADTVDIVTNTPPVADAGTDSNGFVNAAVNLDGTGSSDADSDPLGYAWTFQSRPGGSILANGDIVDNTTSTPYFVPDVAGTYVLELAVDDSTANAIDTVTITVADTELMGEWLFNAGNADDTSPYGNHGTLGGGVTPTPDRAGNTDHAFHFNGIDGFIDLGNTASLNHTDYTSFACWIRPDNLGAANRIISKRNTSPVSGWEFGVGSGDNLSINRNGVSAAAANPAGVTQGSWHHVAFTWDPHAPAAADQLRIYLDGVFIAGTTVYAEAANELDASSLNLLLGRAAYANVFPFTGAIDDVRLYHGVLSDSDVAALAAETAPNTPPTADAGTDGNYFINSCVPLDGTGTTDPNSGDTLTYSWTFQSTPGGSVLTDGDIVNAAAANAHFFPDVAGNYIVEIAVGDGTANDVDTVTITAADTELVGEWMFDLGDARDTGPFANDGTIGGGAILTQDRGSNPGRAYLFNGADSFIDLGNDASLNYTDLISMSFWVRPDNLATFGRVISKRNSPTVEGWEIRVGSGDSINFTRGDTAMASANPAGVIQGNWHHIVFTWDPFAPTNAERFKLYLDGIYLGATAVYGGSATPPVTSSRNLTLGMSAYGASYFTGAIDDIRLYHGILDQDDVTALSIETP